MPRKIKIFIAVFIAIVTVSAITALLIPKSNREISLPLQIFISPSPRPQTTGTIIKLPTAAPVDQPTASIRKESLIKNTKKSPAETGCINKCGDDVCQADPCDNSTCICPEYYKNCPNDCT